VTAIGSKFPAGLPLSNVGIAAAAAFAIAIGLFAGLFPSLTASRMTPVEALRA
jgi:ABC-type antimicrobial peptide transport system permease subunit